MTRKAQQDRRAARLAKQQNRARQLRYMEQQGGTWALSSAEEFELDSLTARMEQARTAYETNERRVDVQLRLAQVA